MKKFLTVYFIFWASLLPIRAQETFSSGGGTVTNESGSFSFVIGQMTQLDNPGITYGVLQVYEEAQVLQAHLPAIEMEIYPNPVAQYLQVRVSEESLYLDYQLFDLQGKALISGQLTPDNRVIEVSHLIPNLYQLVIRNGDSSIKTFKVLKK